MSLDKQKSEPGASAFTNRLGAAFRGGAIMLCASMVWWLFLAQRGDPFMRLMFGWLSSAWLAFPVGVALGVLLPRFLQRHTLLSSVGVGLLVGAATSLVLTTGVWLWSNHQALIGLVTNRNSGGYASYSYSVRNQLREEAWRSFVMIAPVVTAWVTAWAIWFNRSKRNGPDAYENDAASTAVHLRLDRQALLVFISSLIGFGILATAALLITSWVTRGIQVPYSSFLAVGPAAAGLVILGPWLGPLINPGGGSSTAWQLTSVALPVLVFGVAPFFIWRRPVRIAKAITAWCGLVTALLFWIAVGVLSLGWSIG